MKEKYENQIDKLYMEIGKLTTDLNWLKKNVDISLYYKPVPASEEEVALKHRIDEIYTDYPFFGSRRITVLLRVEGLTINRKYERKSNSLIWIERVICCFTKKEERLTEKIVLVKLVNFSQEKIGLIYDRQSGHMAYIK